jgi:aspartyl/asparaginyl beta-hydroxylase (cupin superfamily)
MKLISTAICLHKAWEIINADRNFQPDVKYEKRVYYLQHAPGLPMLGLFNTTIRKLYPDHGHFFNVNDFSSDKKIKMFYEDIKNEALNLYKNDSFLSNMSDLSETFEKIDVKDGKWKVFNIKWYGEIFPLAKKLAPKTCEIISKCSDITAAMFSIVEPGKKIPLHRGPSALFLRYHLGLSIPDDTENCFIVVNNEKYNWKMGESVIFDDTYGHYVENNTDQPRIVLFCDIQRPTNKIISKIINKATKYSNLSLFIQKINDLEEKKAVL